MLAALLVAAAAAVISACGDEGSTSASEDTTTAIRPANEPADREPSGGEDGEASDAAANEGDTDNRATGTDSDNGADGSKNGSESGSAEASAEFRTPGGDNSVQEYGSEAGEAERQAASAVVEGFMAARAAGDWEEVCTRLAASIFESIEKVTAPGAGCIGTFEAIAKRLPPEALANTMDGPIDSLRTEGGRGFALYHGKEGKDYFLQVSQEAGGWKVAGLEPTELP